LAIFHREGGATPHPEGYSSIGTKSIRKPISKTKPPYNLNKMANLTRQYRRYGHLHISEC